MIGPGSLFIPGCFSSLVPLPVWCNHLPAAVTFLLVSLLLSQDHVTPAQNPLTSGWKSQSCWPRRLSVWLSHLASSPTLAHSLLAVSDQTIRVAALGGGSRAPSDHRDYFICLTRKCSLNFSLFSKPSVELFIHWLDCIYGGVTTCWNWSGFTLLTSGVCWGKPVNSPVPLLTISESYKDMKLGFSPSVRENGLDHNNTHEFISPQRFKFKHQWDLLCDCECELWVETGKSSGMPLSLSPMPSRALGSSSQSGISVWFQWSCLWERWSSSTLEGTVWPLSRPLEG